MKVIGNILWLLFTGLWTGLMYCLLGIVWCITIIGIPFGKQCFKIGKLMFWPFGRRVDAHFGKHAILNIIWIIFGGLELAIVFAFLGLIWCITIVGIPFGKQCFKFAKLAFMPFGAEITNVAAEKKAEAIAAKAE